MNRRGFIGSIIASACAPAIVKAEILMPVRRIVVPGQFGFVPWKSSHRSENLNAEWMVAHETLLHALPLLSLERFSEIRGMPVGIGKVVHFRRYVPYAK